MAHPIEHLTVPEIQALIKLIDGFNLEEQSIDDIKKQTTRLSKGLVIFAPRFEPPLTLFRGVRCTTEGKPQTVARIGYCPQHLVSQLGRVNRIGNTIFYGCTFPGAVFLEINAQAGDVLAIGHWQTSQKLQTNVIGYSEESFSRVGANREIPDYAKSRQSGEQNEINQLISNYFHEKFVLPVTDDAAHLYKPSIAIAEYWLKPDFVHGLIYPSVAANLNSDNIAVKTEFVDRYMSLTRVDLVKVTSRQNTKFFYEPIDSATSFENGNIIWKGHPDQWSQSENDPPLQFRKDKFGFLSVAQDNQGNNVPPDEF